MIHYQTLFQPVASLEKLWQKLQPELAGLAATELQQQLDDQIDHLKQALNTHDPEAYPQGQALLCLLIGNYPQFTPLIERQLLWFFGGDCLHFLSDEEINAFQQAEESAAAVPGAEVTRH